MNLHSLRLLCCVVGCAALAPLVRAQASAPTESSAPKSQADLDYEATWAIYRRQTPTDLRQSPRESFQWSDRKHQEFAAASRVFGEKYPNDPRRYEFWMQSSYTGPSYIKGFKPEFDARPGWGGLISDDAAVLKFRSGQLPLLTQIIEAADATPRQREGAFYALMVDSGIVARLQGGKFQPASLRPLVDRVVDRFPDERVLKIVDMFADALRRDSESEATAFLASLQDKPALQAAMQAAEEKREAAAAEKAKKLTAVGAMKFTAADGREVDIAALKGKVVLIDFWATWCGPCIAELPNVKKVYAGYHDRGFEIVGVTLENSNTRPNDTPEETAAKLAAAKQKMLEFVEKNQMPWPQYFDGKWWKNDYVVQFGIGAIPAMVLLDKQGQIASTEARGPKLEAEVKRLLGL
ncbi:MAG: TlpA family protein disulfide reductase [Lacunisphaera sp.]|nr:TlpA family protein disulfide reductase [Lacunisphaera sp.]